MMILEKIPNEAPPHSLYLSLFALSPFSTLSHSHDIGPRLRPRPRNQDRIASTGRYKTGPARTGQGRQGQARHRHNSASSDPHIASAKYRITVSHLPSFARAVRAV